MSEPCPAIAKLLIAGVVPVITSAYFKFLMFNFVALKVIPPLITSQSSSNMFALASDMHVGAPAEVLCDIPGQAAIWSTRVRLIDTFEHALRIKGGVCRRQKRLSFISAMNKLDSHKAFAICVISPHPTHELSIK
jgi:hypothetical protein